MLRSYFCLVKKMKSAYENLHCIHQKTEICREAVGEDQVSDACEHLKQAICLMEECLIKNGVEEGELTNG